jgi:magnesium-protoporphyrin IX monomethyl ester (oxidative) cyclase
MISSPKNVKAAVVIPPFTDFYSTAHRFSTLGAGIVTRLLEKNGVEVEFFNFPEQNSRGTSTTLPTTLHYLKPHLISNETGRCSFFTQYKFFGPPLEECVRQIMTSTPDIIFLSCFAFCYADTAISLCRMLKEKLPHCPIIAGGGGVSVNQGHFISSSCIDFTVSGEAEVSLLPLLKFIKGNNHNSPTIPNILEKNSSNVYSSASIFTNSMSIEPGFRTVLHNNRLRIDVTISRGCPFQCTFCSNHLSHGNEFRRVSIDKIKGLIGSIRETLSVEPSHVDVNFEDDNLLIDPQFWFEVISLFRSAFPRVSLYAENGLDYRLLTSESALYLINQGMAQFNIALGNINAEATSSMSRKTSLEQYDTLLAFFSEHEIPSVSYFIAGIDGDSRKNIAENLIFLSRRKTQCGISMFYPVPGLPGFSDRKMFKPGESVRCCGSSAFPWNSSVGTETLISAFRLSRFTNLLKSEHKSQDEKELIEKSLRTKVIHTIIKNKDRRLIIEVPHQDRELAEMVFEGISL